MAKNPRLIDMSGQQCGDWIVLRQAGNSKGGGALWLSRCTCGVERPVLGADMRSGKSKNCGCKTQARLGELNRTHSGSGTRLHNIWKMMLARCENPSDGSYANYGGRGISVSSGWHDFATFRKWALANGYRDDLSIDRVDNNKGYYPQNCRWANATTQSRNRRFVALTSDGRPGPEVAEENGIPARTYNVRRCAGWSVDEAATFPYRQRRHPRARGPDGKFVQSSGVSGGHIAQADTLFGSASINETLPDFSARPCPSHKTVTG